MGVKDGVPWFGIVFEEPLVEGDGLLGGVDVILAPGPLMTGVTPKGLVKGCPGQLTVGEIPTDPLVPVDPSHGRRLYLIRKVVASPDDLIPGHPSELIEIELRGRLFIPTLPEVFRDPRDARVLFVHSDSEQRSPIMSNPIWRIHDSKGEALVLHTLHGLHAVPKMTSVQWCIHGEMIHPGQTR